MRDYGKVSPKFWIGDTGKSLRGNMEAQIVALYLMTSPHANMIGVFYCPIDYIAKETGIPLEGASKALQCLIEADFCTFEYDSEYIFVHQFALNQIGEELKPLDKRVQGVINELAKVPKRQCWQSFRARYAVPFNLPIEGSKTKPLASPLQAPSKPEAEAEAEAGTEIQSGFALFWSTYPKKAAKPAAAKAFKSAKINGALPAVLADIESRANGDDWTKEGGKYIPNPATYLNQRRWEDGVTAQKAGGVLAGAI